MHFSGTLQLQKTEKYSTEIIIKIIIIIITKTTTIRIIRFNVE